MNISNNIAAPCLLIAAMIILILFQSVFFTNSDVVYTEPVGGQSLQSDQIIDENIDFIALNNIKYKPDKFFILAVISNICAFLLPAVFYIKLKGAGYSKNLKLDLPKPKYIALVIYMFLVLISGTVLINSLMFYFGGPAANIESVLPFMFFTGGNPVYDMGILISFVILPAFCEELFFRAVLSAEYEKYGAFCAVIITSAAFAMSHFSLKFFPSYFFAAIIFYILAKITNSVLYAMILHAGYNFCSIYLLDKLLGVLKFEQNRVIFIFLISIILIIFINLVLNNLEGIYYKKAYGNEPSPVVLPENKRRGTIIVKLSKSFFSPTFLAAIIIFIIYIFI
ncbi:MAG: CPBP family intramembrane metalloprotease [Oscillospiraceae bacterium]|nr:CPBP family intramembrane metalloprotease [Oscillospiraceae bacterium]